MKGNIQDIIKKIRPETTIEEIISYCDTTDDLDMILANLPQIKSKPTPLSDDIKQEVLNLIKTNNLNPKEITTSFIQKNLPVSYSKATALVDWLKTIQ